MGMKHFMWAALAVVLSVGALAPKSAHSAVIIDFVETGGDVTMTLTGSLNVSALGTPSSSGTGFSMVWPSRVRIAVSGTVDMYSGVGLTGPALGTGGVNPTLTLSGDPFFMDTSEDRLGVPAGYVSGTALSSTLTFLNTDFASLGMAPGSYLYTFPGDTITVNVGSIASVPAPAGLPLALAGLGAVALVRQRRKKTKHA